MNWKDKIFSALGLNAVAIITGVLQFFVGNTTTALATLGAGIGGVVSYLLTPKSSTKILGGGERRMAKALFWLVAALIAVVVTIFIWLWQRLTQ